MTSIVFDIETGPLSEAELHAVFEPPQPPEQPGEFNPDSVKLGNLKDEAKIQERIEKAKQEHDKQCREYDTNVKKAHDEAWEKFVDSAALSPVTGQVLAVGAMDARGVHQVWHGDGKEQEVIEGIWMASPISPRR